MRRQRIPTLTLAITLVLASVAAACGGDGSSGPDASGDAGFVTTTLPPLAPNDATTPTQVERDDQGEGETAPDQTTTSTTIAEGDAPVTTLPPDPAPAETAPAGPSDDTAETLATTVPATTTVAAGATQPATTDAPTTTAGTTITDAPTTDPPTTDAPATDPPTTTEPPTTTAAPTTTTAKTLTRQEILDAAADNVSKLQPNNDRRLIEVLNVADGSITSLAEAVDGDRPVLLWFWAPH